jgi:hypothetical protein
MFRAGWVTRGHLVTPGAEVLPIALGLAGARQLQRSASSVQSKVRSERYHGTIDGWTWSSATLQFKADEGQTIKAAVPMPLQTEVARLNATRHQRGTATFQVLERQAPNGGAISRTYALADLSADERLPFDEPE